MRRHDNVDARGGQVVATASPEFFEATSQLLPVFYLAAVVETRLRLPVTADEPPPTPRRILWAGTQRLGLLAGVVAAEVAALSAVAGKPTALSTYVVTLLLGVLGVLLMAPRVLAEIEDMREHVHHRALRVSLVTLAAVVMFLPLVPSYVVLVSD